MIIRLTLLLLVLLTTPVTAGLVEISWSEQGMFQHQQVIEAGGFAEVCGALAAGEKIAWTYDAVSSLDFNIHYHEGEEVVYPVKAAGVAAMADTLVAPVDQTYCWMWTNKNDLPVSLSLQLTQSGEVGRDM